MKKMKKRRRNGLSLTATTHTPLPSTHTLPRTPQAALGGAVTPAMLALHFGPVDGPLGAAYAGDPSVSEATATLGEATSLFTWLDRFPHWCLGARPLPPAPPPPGVAAVRAAAAAEGADPDTAVEQARAQGEIPRLADLPAPWGPKPYVKPAVLKAV
jgi:hypothetical protein